MGCYDSSISILRPLLGSSSNNGSNNNNNNSSARINKKKANGWFSFRRRKAGYNGMEEDIDVDDLKVEFTGNNSKGRCFPDCDTIMGVVRKVGLLVWKNLLLRKRHYIVTTLEILLPTLFSLVLVYGRSQASTSEGGSAHAIPSNPSSALANNDPDIFPELPENVCRLYYYNIFFKSGI